MSTLAQKLRHELDELLPPTIYFFLVLHLVAFIQALMNRHNGIALPTSMQITVAALVLGKSVLLANLLPFINRYPTEPLIWNIGWKATIYFFVALLIHYLERLVEFWRKATDFIAANQTLLAEINWGHFWAIQLLLALLITVYCVMSELIRVIGRAQMKAIFFGPIPRNRSS